MWISSKRNPATPLRSPKNVTSPLDPHTSKGDKWVEGAGWVLYTFGPRSIRNRVECCVGVSLVADPTRFRCCSSSSLSQKGWGFCSSTASVDAAVAS